MITENGGSHYEDYYWGWSFTHFMMETPAYAKSYRKFFVDLARAPDVKRTHGGMGSTQFETIEPAECLRVFRKRMGVTDDAAFEKLEKDWYAYVEKLQAPGVRGYEEAGEKAFWDGYGRFRAPRLLRKAIELGSRKPDVYIALSRCLRASPEGLPEAFEVIKKGCEIDPLNAELWAERGFVLQLAGNKDEGKKLVDLAYELNPGGYYADFQTLLAQADGK
jgi:tetratricopeptide (TPR) repeat protein